MLHPAPFLSASTSHPQHENPPPFPTRLVLLDGDDIHVPFVGTKESGHNVASYVIATEDAPITQDGCHGTTCKCGEWPCPHEVASDAPYYNLAPSREMAGEIVRRWNLVAEMETSDVE